MATARIARIEAAEDVRHVADGSGKPTTRLLDLVMADGAPLGFRGGQYIIVNSGIELAGGKLAKRAYSVLSDDADQTRVRLAVKRIPDGAASGFLQHVPVGGEVPFSGPWGKLGPEDDAPRRTLLVATDTGITAILGLLASRAMRPSLGSTCVLWFVESGSYFLSPDFVAARVPSSCGGLHVETIPPVGHPARVFQARHAMAPWLGGGGQARGGGGHGCVGDGFEAAFLAGDGAVLHAIERQLVEAGLDQARIRMEAFFNNPARKAPSTTAPTVA